MSTENEPHPSAVPAGAPPAHLAALGDANARFVFLAEASTVLADSLDYHETLARLARLAVPVLADWATVSVVEAGGAIRRLAVATADPAQQAVADRLRDRLPPDPGAATGVAAVIRTGRSQLHGEVDEALLRATAHDDEYLRLTRELGLRSAMIVPLPARGRVLGAMTFVMAGSGRSYDATDLAFAEDLARRAAVTIDNARLHSEVVAAEQRFERLVHSVGAIVAERLAGSPQHRFVSRRAEDLLGYPASRWLDEPEFWLAVVHPLDRERVRAESAAAVDARRNHELEFRAVASDGRVVWLRAVVEVGLDELGRVVLREVILDVTDRRRGEDVLRQLSSTLQASLLPPKPPQIEGMEVAARYRAAAGQIDVGGDFYDVFRLRGDDWGIVLGDVCGKGASAAALTALARYTVRAAAVHVQSPAGVLAELNQTLLAEEGLGERFCTGVYARVEPADCGAWVTVAVGGHPRPIVVRRAGWLDVRGGPGGLVGLFPGTEYSDDRVGLGPGDALVLMTDGITEARRADGRLFGEGPLQEVLRDVAGAPAETIATALQDAALAFGGEDNRDDIAILVLRVPGEPIPAAQRDPRHPSERG